MSLDGLTIYIDLPERREPLTGAASREPIGTYKIMPASDWPNGDDAMDKVSRAIKKIDELIREAAEEKRLDKRRMSPIRALTTVRKILTQQPPAKAKI